MDDLLNLIDFDDENVFRFLLLILKFANDKDVGQFLENIKEGLLDREPFAPYEYDLCNKEFLLKYVFGCRDPRDESYVAIIFKHLYLMSMCYYTNECYSNKRGVEAEKSINIDWKYHCVVTPDRQMLTYRTMGRVPRIEGITFEELEAFTSPKQSEFEEIFHMLVEHFKKYKYYYYIVTKLKNKPEDSEKYVSKMNIDNNGKVYGKMYPIEEKDSVSWLTDIDTGIEYNTHRNLLKFCANFERGVAECKSSHKYIVRALNGEEPCNWCNPNVETTKEMILCPKCNRLAKNLSENGIKINDLTEYITSNTVSNENYKLADLRHDRKLLVKRYVKEEITNATIDSNSVKPKIKEINEEIKKTFLNKIDDKILE